MRDGHGRSSAGDQCETSRVGECADLDFDFGGVVARETSPVRRLHRFHYGMTFL